MINCMISFLAGLIAVFLLMPGLIDRLKKLSFNQTVSEYSLQEYKEKAKTPIMGGLLFIIVPIIITMVSQMIYGFRADTAILLLSFAGYGAIGFIDDWLIAVRKNNDGLLPRYKFAMQVVLAVVIYVLYVLSGADLSLRIPFANTSVYLGVFYAALILFMFAGSSNAVNLTDGMDGLAAGCSVFSFAVFLILSLLAKKPCAVSFFASLIGSLIGYLYYNVKPAKVFMGDTGSLALGGALAAGALILNQVLALIVIGGVFVIETLCVMIQIGSVKTRHRRVFPYTPIHYAFVLPKEKGGLGMGEVQTVHLFWLASAVFAVLGLFVALH